MARTHNKGKGFCQGYAVISYFWELCYGYVYL